MMNLKEVYPYWLISNGLLFNYPAPSQQKS